MTSRIVESSATATTVSVLTPPGRGAIAIIAVEGPHALEYVQRSFCPQSKRQLTDRKLGALVYGRWGTQAGEDVIVCRRSANRIEIHCHGGATAPARIFDDLKSAGIIEESWPQFVQRHERSRISAAARIALARSTTERTAKILLDQYHGALQTSIRELVYLLEEPSSKEDLVAATSAIRRLLQHAAIGLHLTRPWQVVIAGPPNVGKSSLINALLGYRRAIVFDEPGTTRDIVTAQTALEGWPVELSDTAGLRASDDPLELAGVERAMQQAASADLLLLVFDASQPMSPEFCRLTDDWPAALSVGNKCDLPVDQSTEQFTALRTSAVTGRGIDELIAGILSRLVPIVPKPEEAVPFTAEQVEQLSAAQRQMEAGEIEAARRGLLAMLA
jgi:tRNA modification GTPase